MAGRTKRVSVSLDHETWQLLRQLAPRLRTSVNRLMLSIFDREKLARIQQDADHAREAAA
ncbi:MAG: hypothetical protein A3E01_03065 [Gammaproteobacteria bacterium RIFCSPHIGHO2_12_FULL_63_22]|nr:MAG: hypothetical protein A3E01_03065 [Gammaproteobacteria bacterium RIFCSPHIGHO2_12_FULL_63_22]